MDVRSPIRRDFDQAMDFIKARGVGGNIAFFGIRGMATAVLFSGAGAVTQAFPEMQDLFQMALEQGIPPYSTEMLTQYLQELRQGYLDFSQKTVSLISSTGQYVADYIASLREGNILERHEDFIKALPAGDIIFDAMTWAQNSEPKDDSLLSQYGPQVVSAAGLTLVSYMTVTGIQKSVTKTINMAISGLDKLAEKFHGALVTFGLKPEPIPNVIYDPFTQEVPDAVSGDRKRENDIAEKMAGRLESMGLDPYQAESFSKEIVKSFANLGHHIRTLESEKDALEAQSAAQAASLKAEIEDLRAAMNRNHQTPEERRAEILEIIASTHAASPAPAGPASP